jgi:hypothetical protein
MYYTYSVLEVLFKLIMLFKYQFDSVTLSAHFRISVPLVSRHHNHGYTHEMNWMLDYRKNRPYAVKR